MKTARPKTVWLFDINRRTYPPPLPGEKYAKGGPIYREHWHEVEVLGETSRSWLLRYGQKIPKNGSGGRLKFARSVEEVDQDVYLHDHAYTIGEKVKRLGYDKLLAVARLIGYEEKQS